VTREDLPYEPALDGLRAVAVLSVMLYHGQVAWSQGGFLGVDLFFVLSGYLITSLLVAEQRRSGSIDLMRFWGRRARRLLPALFLVLLAVCVYSVVWARSTQRESLRLDALSTLGYAANWRLALTHQSYFAQYDDPSPLRHMWSLGIEEQFYLAFPLLLLGWLALSRGRTRLLRAGLGLGALASAALMATLYEPSVDPSRVYYGTDTRAQALLVGAFLALFLADHPRRRSDPRARTYLRLGPFEVPVPGWTLLGLAAFVVFLVLVLISRDLAPWLYRGGFLMAAIVGALLIAAATRAPERSVLRRLLSWPPLRAVGVISYGLYLWHWPVYVVLDPTRTSMQGTALLLVRVTVTFVLATASYLYVERPIRRGGGIPVLRQLSPAWVTATALALLAVLIVGSTLATPVALPSANAGPAAPALPGAVRVYVIGDSVAYGLWFEFQQATDPGIVVRGSTQLGCGLLQLPLVVSGQVEPLDPSCPPFDKRWPLEVKEIDPGVVVLMLGIGEQFDREVGGATVTFGTPAYERFIDEQIDQRMQLLGAGGRPVALVTVPCHRVLESGVNQIPVIINDESRVDWLNGVQRRYAASHAGQVSIIDLHGFVCPNGYTEQIPGVQQLHTDGLHFTPEGVQAIWRWMGPQLVALTRKTPVP
jgi:peptidoglycan/LPS O-acetylase OafA/YrhL